MHVQIKMDNLAPRGSDCVIYISSFLTYNFPYFHSYNGDSKHSPNRQFTLVDTQLLLDLEVLVLTNLILCYRY